MLTAYLTTLIIGGSLLLLSIVAGGNHELEHGSLELDGDVDFDGDVDAGMDIELHADGHDGLGAMDLHGFDAWLPVGSLRFWTFGMAFFGLVGTALSAVQAGWGATLGASIGVGYISGVVAVKALRSLTKASVSSVVGQRELVGTSGVMVLPASKGKPGKIRMQLGGRTLEEIANTDIPLAAGTKVLIIGIKKDEGVLVTPIPELTSGD